MIRAWITLELENGSIIKYVNDKLADTSTGAIQSLSINNGGSGYKTSDIGKILTLATGNANAVAAITAVGATSSVTTGPVTGVSLLDTGTGYTTQSTGSITTTGGTGSGLTLNSITCPGSGQIATVTVLNAGTATYQANDILQVNPINNGGFGARIKVLTVTGGPPGVVATASVISSGSGYVVGNVLTTIDTTTTTGTGATFVVASVSSGVGIPRQYYAYDGNIHNYYTENSAGQIQNDFATIYGVITTGTSKFMTWPDSYAPTATVYAATNSYQPNRGLLSYDYITLGQIVRVFVTQEWFDASGTGILPYYGNTPYLGIDGPTYQVFS